MRKEFDEDKPKKSTRGKKNNQKMKPFLVYQYLMRHTDKNHDDCQRPPVRDIQQGVSDFFVLPRS